MPSGRQTDTECVKLADHVAALIQAKFSEITNQLTSEYARRKVLAGVVMMHGSALTDGKVICVTTGTKCIVGDHLSDTGVTVNDCHAEILARRCLCRFLYLQAMRFLLFIATEIVGNHTARPTQPSISLWSVNEDQLWLGKIQDFIRGAESVFIPSESGSGFALKPGIDFHLYISSAPCGDARIFSPHEADSSREAGSEGGDKHPNRLARGQLRTKIESGEGTIPVQSNDAGMQTWDGIMLGERLLTMSCSDKLARMNVLGVQGAMLSLLVEPIYFSSIISGSLYHRSHITRALFGRINLPADSLPVGYRLAQPLLTPTSQPEPRLPQKAPTFATNWVVHSPQMEVINTSTGKLSNGAPSRLCKAEMFRLFAETWNQLNSGQDFPPVYGDVKRMADDYQMMKVALYKSFKEGGFGCWMERPMEQDGFVLPKLLAE